MLDARNPHQALQSLVAPTSEPMTLATAKQWARVSAANTADDAIITFLITAAREYVETHARRSLLTQTWLFTLDRFPIYYDWYEYSPYQTTAPYQSASQWQTQNLIYLPRPPLQSVSSIQYVDTSGVLQTLAPSEYQVDNQSEPGRVGPAFATFWPSTQAQIGAVRIEYIAGWTGTSPSLVPSRAVTAIGLLVGHWYVNREAVGAPLAAQPLAVSTLCWQLRQGRYV